MNRVTEYPVQNLLAERYSPRSFLDRPVEERDMRIILEAGRLAPSCFNEQPGPVFTQSGRTLKSLNGSSPVLRRKTGAGRLLPGH